ncbi:tRNA dihydrouridine(20/20a) synthase DusA [Aquicoccus porphyridii]|uniref:tRNA-dihydrouridine(20/20a) synthase n=1 Tax=Aquicoccus porphyridii TaxID=1852029 RepID=A0A5A9ZHX3_9RHOB|nr:tRNA dihydrouridine(20/20a) synthase DusA [Aquicoccus porphyridii]KAA0916606.1 tRNA dihydrouridine(20/20a) synthase DusA [Aquicoccus porphyridii]RAI53739.1 tRNA dihydrouridine(20/20a) synthase DusA [Rhodobacteraceae bacterium AsT-22]
MPLDQNARLSCAPMMDWTDRHCRYFHRQLSTQALLYTEMVTAPALVRGGALHLLDRNPAENPVTLQLGGADPAELARAARVGGEAGFDEINLNCGCPSDRVQSGTFGAVLMKNPALVKKCCAAMIAEVDVPVTVKCRIGVDDQNPEEVLPEFLAQVVAAGVERVTIHARKAWLRGLSPKENRDIPPLDYDLVQRMKMLFPNLHISLNGGIETLDQAVEMLEKGFNGVMVGRAAYHRPWDVLGRADERVFGLANPNRGPKDVALAMLPYIREHLAAGGRLHQVTRHMLGLFHGRPGARQWRRILSEGAVRPDAGVSLLEDALGAVEDSALSA